jgi:hypothetical protein
MVNPKTSVYQGVLRSMSVTVTPTWLIVAISGMVGSGGRDGDVKSVGGDLIAVGLPGRGEHGHLFADHLERRRRLIG